MLTIYLVRHGETEWNRKKSLQGWQDSPLTEKGIKQAQLLGAKLADTNFHAIYSSPLKRAVETTEYICSGRNLPIHIEKNLKEINFGDWEGREIAEVKQKYKTEFFNFWNYPEKYDAAPHNGEDLSDFKQRVEAAMKRILAENDSGNILVVAHGLVINAILSYIMDYPTEKIWDHPFIHNTSLTIFHWDGQSFRVDSIGDTSHDTADM